MIARYQAAGCDAAGGCGKQAPFDDPKRDPPLQIYVRIDRHVDLEAMRASPASSSSRRTSPMRREPLTTPTRAPLSWSSPAHPMWFGRKNSVAGPSGCPLASSASTPVVETDVAVVDRDRQCA